MQTILLALLLAACAYQVVATILCRRFAKRTPRALSRAPEYCLVKPLLGPNPQTLSNVSRFLEQIGPVNTEVFLCSAQPGPEEWLSRHPQVRWLEVAANQSVNGKASSLGLSQSWWSGDVFIVSDADMLASPGYLQAVLAEFEDPKVGVVTCLYRGFSETLSPGGMLEALCIQDFAASVLVAEQTEGLAFCLGSTMAVRREALEDIGGFEALSEYLADDFQLGYRAVRRGWKVTLAPTMTETDLGSPRWGEAWAHQYRWLVTSRVSRPAGHLAFLVTQGFLWALLLAWWQPLWLGLWCCLRVALGTLQGAFLYSGAPRRVWDYLWFPLKDLLYLLLWGRSLVGQRVVWGRREITIDSSGRIVASRELA